MCQDVVVGDIEMGIWKCIIRKLIFWGKTHREPPLAPVGARVGWEEGPNVLPRENPLNVGHVETAGDARVHSSEGSDASSSNLGSHASPPHRRLFPNLNRRILSVDFDALRTRLVWGLVENSLNVSEKCKSVSLCARGEEGREAVVVGENAGAARRASRHHIVSEREGRLSG